MSNYQNQKNASSTVFRAKSAKVAMGDARIAFGMDVEILSVEKVGGVYCVEVTNPASKSAIGQDAPVVIRNRAVASVVPKSGDSSLDLVSMHSIERLERKFEELSARVVSQSHQGGGLSELGSIRESLSGLGFGEPFLGKLAGAMVERGAVSYSKDLAMRIVSSWLERTGQAHDLESGVHAIVGPAGSGKTTTIAKLASRAVVRNGASRVGLVTTDFYRVGAYEQLKVFGDLLGVKVYGARSSAELAEILGSLSGRHVVYVDTIGTSRDDERMMDQMAMLASLGVNLTMALQASLARSVMRSDISKWGAAGAKSAIITKLDEAAGLAGLVESLIVKSIPVCYATNGQRVPADFHKISPLLLAHKTFRQA